MITQEKLSPLSEAKVGECFSLARIDVQGTLRRRLLDLGFVPGNTVEAVRRSPLGDPMAFRVNQTVIALRREESSLIYGYKLESGGATHEE